MSEVGAYPVLNGGMNPSGFTEKYNEEKDTITISQGGASAGYVNWMDRKFWAGAHCFVVKPNNDVLNNRYLYFILKNSEHILMQAKQGAGIPGLNRDKVKNLMLPVPPLEVQEEIVRILDHFTNLAAELQAELQARKEQYEYYRNKLLAFAKTDGVEYKKLGEVCTINRGIRVVRSQLTQESKYPVYQNSLIPLGNYDYFNCEANTTFIIAAGAAGKIGFCKSPFWAADDCFYFKSQKLEQRYIYHVLLSNQDYFIHKVRKASVPRISRSIIEKFEIPIPSLSKQQYIVSILDKFDALVNDLSQGLPAEIAAVKEQYEYYRNKLLSFPRI